MLKIRRSGDRLIFNMGIPYLEKMVFILRRGPIRLVLFVDASPIKHSAITIRFRFREQRFENIVLISISSHSLAEAYTRNVLFILRIWDISVNEL